MSARRLWIGVGLTVAVVAGLGFVFREPVILWSLQKMAVKKMMERPLDDLPDGLHVGLCGAGSPFPDPRREPACNLFIAGKRLFMIDAGSAAARNLGRMGFNPGDVEALFLTHFHSDHIDGLGELQLQRWGSSANKEPLPVYGPGGVAMIVNGINLVYSQDMTYRVAHHGAETMPPGGAGLTARSFDLPAPNGRVVLIDEPDLQVTAFGVSHSPVHPAVGYRIRYKDRTVVFSGDTSKSANVQREAKGVDLLVHEALQTRLTRVLGASAAEAGRKNLAKVFGDIENYHTTPEQAAEIARDAGVRFLMFSHIVPALPFPGLEGIFVGDAAGIFKGRMKVGIDGDFVSLPVGNTDIVLSKKR